MIRIDITETEQEYKLIMSGHADYNPGNDIVCAAASILGQTAVQVMYELEDAGQVEMIHDIVSNGQIYLEVKVAGSESMLFERMKTIRTGFELLSSTYPDHVRFGWGS